MALPGRGPPDGQSLEIRAKAVVNATGPWSDKLPHSHTDLRLTKGVHLVVDRRAAPGPRRGGDGRGFPHPLRHSLGPTASSWAPPTPTTPAASRTCGARRTTSDTFSTWSTPSFPSANLAPADLISVWAGLRPLVADRNGNPSDISRRHEIRMGEPGWWDVTGGKLTTYRLMAEQTVDKLVAEAGLSAGPCRTAIEPLLDPAEADGVSSVVPPAVSEKAVRHYCDREWACHLEDVMVRRTSWRHYHRTMKTSRVRSFLGSPTPWAGTTREPAASWTVTWAENRSRS